jgi:hypothetical protein
MFLFGLVTGVVVGVAGYLAYEKYSPKAKATATSIEEKVKNTYDSFRK